MTINDYKWLYMTIYDYVWLCLTMYDYQSDYQPAFAQFIPCKTVPIRVNDQLWSNSYTRLLLRKKNRNYQMYKKADNVYKNMLNQQTFSQEIMTKYLKKKNKAQLKAQNASNESTKANRRVKLAFFNSVNSTMNNSSISAKNFFC